MKERKKYAVYAVVTRHNDSIGMTPVEDYIYIGETYAVSAKQAENNVRFRTQGPMRSKQYVPLDNNYDIYNTIRYEAEEL